MYPFRVFISYSHADSPLADRIRFHIAQLGASPMADVEFVPGVSFTDEIMDRIAHAHVFVPILTESASQRLWVHQEIGYAMGSRVPILPLAVGSLPEGLVEKLHALTLSPDLSDLETRFTSRRFDDVIRRGRNEVGPVYEAAGSADQRTDLLVRYSQGALRYGHGRVKQMSAFTSFSIPDQRHTSTIWDDREGPTRHSEHVRRQLRQERQLLEQHARQKGCDLIIKPGVRALNCGPKGTLTRLQLLREFLASMSDELCNVAIHHDPLHGNLTIVDDWFVADAVVPYGGVGYLKTMFTRHAPTVLDHVAEFDQLMKDLLAETPLDGRSSRLVAIEQLDREIESLFSEKRRELSLD
ncbi:MAG: toll/interleukin-1 receptor domain-containing protein [Phycisphaeraceae bacterium]